MSTEAAEPIYNSRRQRAPAHVFALQLVESGGILQPPDDPDGPFKGSLFGITRGATGTAGACVC